jgi:hypothetical protein
VGQNDRRIVRNRRETKKERTITLLDHEQQAAIRAQCESAMLVPAQRADAKHRRDAAAESPCSPTIEPEKSWIGVAAPITAKDDLGTKHCEADVIGRWTRKPDCQL